MQIIKKILIKQVITERSKRSLRHKFMQENVQLERECQQLLFEKKKLQHKFEHSHPHLETRFQREIDHRKEKIKNNEFKIEQLDVLEIGSEIVEGEMDALVKVEIGANWKDLSATQSIIIEDDIVKKIEHE